MASRREDRVATFFLTAITTACLTESVTRTISLMRWTSSAIICGGVGLVGLVLVIMVLGLED